MTRRRGLSTRSRLALGAGIVAFVVFAASGAAQATWTALSAALTATAATTNAAVTLSDMSALNTAYSNTAATSAIVIAPVTVGNSGGAPLALALTDTTTNATFAAKIRVWVWTQVAGSCGSTTVGTPGTLAALPSSTTNLAGGVSTVICVATQLQATALANLGQTVTATFLVTGTVGTNWTATATRPVTQSVAPPNVTNVTCTNGLLVANVAWTGVTGATNYSIFTGTTLVATTAGTTYTAGLLNGATSIRIVANYPGGFSSSGVTQPLAPILIGILGQQCG